MQFESKQKRNFWVNAIYGLIPDTIIGIGVASYTDSGFLGFISTVIGLQIVYFLIWLKDSLWQWAFFKIRGKKIMVEIAEDDFRAKKFPAPGDFEYSVEDYLSSVATNEELDPNIRTHAAAIIGGLQYPISTLRTQESLRLTIAYEEALSNFKKTCREVNVTEESIFKEEERLEEPEDENVGSNIVEQWLSQSDEEYLNEIFEDSPVCERCGKGIEDHRVIAVMGRKFPDCISNPLRGVDGEPWGG